MRKLSKVLWAEGRVDVNRELIVPVAIHKQSGILVFPNDNIQDEDLVCPFYHKKVHRHRIDGVTYFWHNPGQKCWHSSPTKFDSEAHWKGLRFLASFLFKKETLKEQDFTPNPDGTYRIADHYWIAPWTNQNGIPICFPIEFQCSPFGTGKFDKRNGDYLRAMTRKTPVVGVNALPGFPVWILHKDNYNERPNFLNYVLDPYCSGSFYSLSNEEISLKRMYGGIFTLSFDKRFNNKIERLSPHEHLNFLRFRDSDHPWHEGSFELDEGCYRNINYETFIDLIHKIADNFPVQDKTWPLLTREQKQEKIREEQQMRGQKTLF